MSESIKVVMAQINPIVGDISGNVTLIIESARQAKKDLNADIIVFPEMTITGYPPEDLLFRPAIYEQINEGLSQICEKVQDIVLVLGYPMMDELGECFNMAAWIEEGMLQASYLKQNLPNYSVFDEKRYFTPGSLPCVIQYQGVNFGLLICEDIWKYTTAEQTVSAGADIILNLNASPFSSEKHQDRMMVIKRRVSEIHKPIIYVNQVGGQDDLVFDGGSFAVCADGEIQVQSPEFKSSLTLVEIVKQSDSIVLLAGEKTDLYEDEARIYQALVLGVKDYIEKNHFPGALLGLSGGIDSALTLAIAVDAIGADKVEAVMMPFRYTDKMSLEDAQLEADALGVDYHVMPIEDTYTAFESALSKRFEGCEEDVTEENLQARIRGTLLMSISNKSGKLVLATSNKSEVAVGYSTLYGDMVGGFSPLKDVPKTLVYRLAKYRNTLSSAIPERVISRPPSAELKPNQTDQDSLPDYDVLDNIIKAYVKEDKTPDEIIKEYNYDLKEVKRIINLINKSEYKRRQSAPGIKITLKAFGRDRRYPITHWYQE